ncbi:MAG TPA: PTS sugar transporter subunit IIA [Candidatus Synoicihabitans sp.]|nr:PTS sugar transporter subunit IIA [Candidatus Synoicihabitans sp.]
MTKTEYLTLGEVAASFGWTPRFVERLAVGGKLPGEELAGDWRFRRDELLDWLDQKVQTLDAARVAELEHKLEAELAADGLLTRPHPDVLTARLQPAGIDLDLAAEGKAAVLRALVDVARRTELVLDEQTLHTSILEREALCSTALPGGVAIVHPRRPLPAAVRDSLLCFARTRKPVPFGAEDGQPTQLFFLLVAKHDRTHLHALARLVRVLQGGTIRALRAAPDPDAMLAILRAREKEIDAASV